MNKLPDKINNVDGCVIESGVHWGYGILAHLFFTGERGYPQRDIYGFDSFEGHSKPNEKDLSGGNFKNLGSHFKISQEDVWKTLTLGTEYNQSQYLGEKVHLIPGWIQETMPTFKRELKMDSIALVHCDVDIYEPFLITLRSTWDSISKNGIVILGKLENSELMGKTLATHEFLADLSDEDYKICSCKINEINTNKPVDLSYLVKL